MGRHTADAVREEGGVRFHLGAVPEDEGFEPDREGWSAIREPGPAVVQLIAIPVMLVAAAIVGGLLWVAGALDLEAFTPVRLLVVFVSVVPVHELAHAALHPGGGLTRQTLIGVWPKRLVFFAHYEGTMSRNRFLAVFAAPTVLLTGAPVLLAAGLGLQWWGLAAIALVNVVSASGDLVGLGLILTQVPGGAVVRNKGWRTYWRARPVLPVGEA